MAHEVLAVKLDELDDTLKLLHSRIHVCESAPLAQLQHDMDTLQCEYIQSSAVLRDSLQHSKLPAISVLSEAYQQIEHTIMTAMQTLQMQEPEEKILLAEYALDFSVQAANRALLCALDAIAAQKNLSEQERSSL